MQRALFKHEEQAIGSVDDAAALGDECLRNPFTRVMDENPMQRPAGRPVAHMQREPALDRGEAPGIATLVTMSAFTLASWSRKLRMLSGP